MYPIRAQELPQNIPYLELNPEEEMREDVQEFLESLDVDKTNEVKLLSNENRQIASLHVYPNLSNGFIHIELYSELSHSSWLSIFNMSGFRVKKIQTTESSYPWIFRICPQVSI